MNPNYLSQLFNTQDSVAVLTGGGGVLCSTMAKALAQAGARVAVLDILPEAAQKVADEIQADDGQAIPVQCDVLDKASVEMAAQTVLSEFSRVDFLDKRCGRQQERNHHQPRLAFLRPAARCTAVGLQSELPRHPVPQPGVWAESWLNRAKALILNISSMSAFQPLTRNPGVFSRQSGG